MLVTGWQNASKKNFNVNFLWKDTRPTYCNFLIEINIKKSLKFIYSTVEKREIKLKIIQFKNNNFLILKIISKRC